MKLFLRATAILFLFTHYAIAYELNNIQKSNLTKKIELIKKIASDEKIVKAVISSNSTPLKGYESMNEEEWFKLQYLDHKIRYFYNSDSAKVLRENKDESMTEMFINNNQGKKVAFLAKTSYWNHGNKTKHIEAMKNKIWIGPVEKDQSSGSLQLQVSVPILHKDIPIGSLIVGLSVDRLK